MKTKFDMFLGQPEAFSFSESNMVVSREHYTQEQALEFFKRDCGEEILISDIEAKWVQYCIGEDDDDFDGGRAWWIKESPGRNRKKVWVVYMFPIYKRRNEKLIN